MAETAAPRLRPMAPHLQVWRWGPHMLVSILNRVTGSGLAVVGLPIVLWWLGAVVAGPAAYARFLGYAGAWYGLAVLAGLTWALVFHTLAGLRHFVMDIGAGYEIDTNKRWSVAVIAISFVLTAAIWAWLLTR